jgi:MYXO-CTERM domain-containing protein
MPVYVGPIYDCVELSYTSTLKREICANLDWEYNRAQRTIIYLFRLANINRIFNGMIVAYLSNTQLLLNDCFYEPMKTKKLVLLTAGLSVLSSVCLTAAEHLINGGFENEPNWGAGFAGDAGFTGLTGAQIPGWTIAPGHGATVHSTAYYPYISGNYSINMDGEGYNGHNADLYQDFSSVLGTTYDFSFDWKSWNLLSDANRLEVSIIDTTTSTVLLDNQYISGYLLDHVMLSFIGTGDSLRLETKENLETGYNDNGFIVDNFSVTDRPVTQSAPDTTSTAGLTVASLLLLAGLRRRFSYWSA